ncbi:MAG: hypothetical protein A2Y38_25285 [Spirochaetes bacterium GWB1_59_5]|nr:MAG: hypothetical protein A2Y38_25285 [Spirochaetes bacterium GWB1_59_5]
MEYCYSDNGEAYHGACKAIAEALDEALGEFGDAEVIQVGEVVNPTIGDILNDHHVENLLDGLQETAGGEYGEFTEGWLDPPRIRPRDVKGGETRDAYDDRVTEWRKKRSERLASLSEDIAAALEKWATEEGEQPGFFGVKNSKDYTRDEAEALIAEAASATKEL